MYELTEKFSERLKEEISVRGYDYKTFGEVAGFPETNISEWCSGKAQPYLYNLIKLADYFNYSIDYLIGKESTKYEPVFKICPPFSDQLKKILKDTNKSNLSKVTGIGRSRIYHWLNGTSIPQLDNLVKLADYFKVTVDILIGRQ